MKNCFSNTSDIHTKVSGEKNHVNAMLNTRLKRLLGFVHSTLQADLLYDTLLKKMELL